VRRRIPRRMPVTRELGRQLADAAAQLAADEQRTLTLIERNHADAVRAAAAKDLLLSKDLDALPARRGRFTAGQRRGLGLAVPASLAVLAIAGVASGTRDFWGLGAPKGPGPDALSADRPIPPRLRPALAVAPDPADKSAPWGMRVYPSARGTCILLGRVVRGEVGRAQAGKFSPLSADVNGFCGRLNLDHIVVSVRSYSGIVGARSILYGVVDRQVVSLTLRAPRSQSVRAVRIYDDASFMAVSLGSTAFRDYRLRIQYRSGRTKTFILQPRRPPGPGRP
jgi:hypothetical protein